MLGFCYSETHNAFRKLLSTPEKRLVQARFEHLKIQIIVLSEKKFIFFLC